MKIFKFFALTKNKRKLAEEPKDKIILVKHGISEFIGTFLLAMSLAGLSTIVAGTDKAVEFYMLHPIMVGFYAGFIAIGILLMIFLRWSCDLNPAVTITRMIKGTNTIRYGLFKIIIQFIAGIIAGLVIYALGKLGNGEASNLAVTSTNAASKSFGSKLGWAESEAAGASWIFIVELIVTSILLFPIFSSAISDKYRDFIIIFIIAMSACIGIMGGSASLNPSRGLAQQIPGLFFGHEAGGAKSASDIITASIAIQAGTLFAPIFYVMCQGLLSEYLNEAFIKIIKFKNYRSSNMKFDAQTEIPHEKKHKK